MVFDALAISVMIASPGDVSEERDVVEKVIRGWNSDRARGVRVVLVPLRWEVDSVAEMGKDAQMIINRQLVDSADIVVGIFDSRLGTSTSRAPSGTAEELARSMEKGCRVHVYFSNKPINRDFDVEQYQALQEYKKALGEKGLLGTFDSIADLEAKVRSALEKDVTHFAAALSSAVLGGARKSLVRFSVGCESDVNAPVGKTGGDAGKILVELKNIGKCTADNVRVNINSADGGEAPISQLSDMDSFTVVPGEVRRFPVYRTPGTAKKWTVYLSWSEGGADCDDSYEVTPNL